MTAAFHPPADADLLTKRSAPHSVWSTANVAEAMPGVVTPLSWTVFAPAVERGVRQTFRSIGVLTEDEAELPADQTEWFLSVFHGRAAGRVDFFCEMGDRLPGASARGVAEQMLHTFPDDIPENPTKRRYPHIAVGYPRTFITAPREMRTLRAVADRQWRTRMPAIATLDLAATRAELARSVDLFRQGMFLQCCVTLVIIQPIFEQFEKALGDAASAVLGGQHSHEESALVADLWACSRGRLAETELLARHGYHGPMEGEISATVWREDPAPLRSLVRQYAERPDSADPARTRVTLLARREEALAARLSGASRADRARIGLLMRLIDRYLPMRGVGKVSFLQALDLCRACARRIGDCLVAEGRLDERDDVFFLTLDELTEGQFRDARAVVAERKTQRERYLGLDLPRQWVGNPEAVPIVAPGSAERPGLVTGTGVNAGVVTGRARVILDPGDADADIDDGEILVARITDPGWAALLFLSSALVVDIGGSLSHAAVVSRELGIPCVVDTRIGTSVLRTGDLIRVDGSAGTVELLEPVASG